MLTPTSTDGIAAQAGVDPLAIPTDDWEPAGYPIDSPVKCIGRAPLDDTGFQTTVEIYRRYGPALLRKCERRLGNRPDAEDIVQGIFVDLPYLYRAATSRCLNRIRDSRRRRELLAQHGEVLISAGPSVPEARAISVDLLAQLVDCLDKKSA